METKRLTKEAEARQGRLEEARERGATAEEALRASKVLLCYTSPFGTQVFAYGGRKATFVSSNTLGCCWYAALIHFCENLRINRGEGVELPIPRGR